MTKPILIAALMLVSTQARAVEPVTLTVGAVVAAPVLGKVVDYFVGDREEKVTACTTVNGTEYCRKVGKTQLPPHVRAILFREKLDRKELREAYASGQILR